MKKNLKILADKDIPFLRGHLESFAEVQYKKGSEILKKDLLNIDALIIRTRTICDKNLLEGTSVQFIATATIGDDHIDKSFCSEKGIYWTNAAGCNAGSVMQYVGSSLIRLAIKYNFDLSAKTLGIVGYGNVGSKVASLAKLFGMKVLINDPPLERAGNPGPFCSIQDIQNGADIITLDVPLNRKGRDKTYHLINDTFIENLKKKIYLINSSRGPVVDGESLKSALLAGRISGAVIDVWENEPKIDLELLKLVDFGTPHIAGYSADGKANGTSMSVAALNRFFKLDLVPWYPDNIPYPEQVLIDFENEAVQMGSWFHKLVLATYDISYDADKLKNDPLSFEHFRADYPLRREFGTYSIKNIPNKYKNRIISMGFKLA